MAARAPARRGAGPVKGPLGSTGPAATGWSSVAQPSLRGSTFPDGRRGAWPAGGPLRPVPLVRDGDRLEPMALGAGAGVPGARRPPALAATPDLIALVRVLHHRWKQALGFGTLCAVLATIAAWYLVPRPKYKAWVL